jgi:hypothetical protein
MSFTIVVVPVFEQKTRKFFRGKDYSQGGNGPVKMFPDHLSFENIQIVEPCQWKPLVKTICHRG